MKECSICGESFSSHSGYANHIRWTHKDNTEYKKKASKSSIKYQESVLGRWIYDKWECNNCGKEFDIKYREGKKKEIYFCSRSCANTRDHSDETKDKISKSVSKLWDDKDYRDNIMKYVGINDRLSSKGEREIRKTLKELYGDKEVQAHRIIEYNNILRAVDMKLPNKNTIIEYDGEWHFRKIKEGHKFEELIEKDKMVKEYCKIKSIKLIRVSDKIYNKNKDKMIKDVIDTIDNGTELYYEFY